MFIKGNTMYYAYTFSYVGNNNNFLQQTVFADDVATALVILYEETRITNIVSYCKHLLTPSDFGYNEHLVRW